MPVKKEKLPPSQLERDITARCQELEMVLKEVNARIQILQKSKPHGRIKIVYANQQYNCIYYKEPGQKKGKYLRKDDLEMAKLVSEYNYLLKLRKALMLQLRSLRRTAHVLKRVKIPTLSKGHSLFTEPVTYKDSVYSDLWQADIKKGPVRQTDYITKKNEVVCSKSELMIANALYEKGVPYHYERPYNFSGVTIHPDFTCLNRRTHKEFVWEHLGMMDDESYAEKAVARLKSYRKNNYILGKQLLITYETKNEHLGTADINSVIENYLL